MRAGTALKGTLIVAMVLFGLRIGAVSPLSAAEVRVGREYGADIASTEVQGCRVSLELNAKWQTLHYRNLCSQPLETKVALFAELLGAVTGGMPPAGIKSLFLGRLVDYPELAVDAALAANAAADWDASKGKLRTDRAALGLNGYFARLLADNDLLRPFLAALAAADVEGGGVSVEKVLVGPPEMTPVETRLLAAGVAPQARLPFDAMVWLRLRPIHDRGPSR